DQDIPGLAKPLADLAMLANLSHLYVEDREGIFDERNVQVLLGAEVEVDRANGQLRRTCDQFDRRAGVAAFREHRASRLLDATASRLPLLRLAFLSVRHAGALVILTQQVKQGISHNGSPTDPLRWHI